MALAEDGPIYLTTEGRRQLEERLAAYEAEFRQRSADAGGAEAVSLCLGRLCREPGEAAANDDDVLRAVPC